jgi:carotenoid 1,2-hydratase
MKTAQHSVSMDSPQASAVPTAAPSRGREASGRPRFDAPVPDGGYLWWYLDALSDDGTHGLSIIAFVGSVFSPYYAWARARGGGVAPAEQFCALNVALYGAAGQRWTMTERGRSSIARTAERYTIGPSSIALEGDEVVVRFDEWAAPIPRRVRGEVRLKPGAWCGFVAGLDAAGRHRWGPMAPCARIEVELDAPRVRWSGPAYMDSNEGDDPIDHAFHDWDWSRARMRDGSTTVIYDVRAPRSPGPSYSTATPRLRDTTRTGLQAPESRVIAQRFLRDGRSEPFEAPPRQELPVSPIWRIERGVRTDANHPARVLETLEDTPFYARSTLSSSVLGEPVVAIHESLSLPRLRSLPVRLMLPWKMPRRG